MLTPIQYRRISVIGLGYIGLPTAAMFASRKIDVIGVDVNPRVVDTINRGGIHIIEPDLDITVQSTVAQGYLRATTAPEPADAFLIAVPTPFKGDNHQPDLSYIEAAAKAIAPVLKTGNLVVLESTSPVGATANMAEWLSKARPDLTFPQDAGEASDIRIAHCPERVLPGKVMQELISNDRIIGGMTRRCSREAALLYKIFVSGDCIIASDPKVAEMAKLTENSFRDVNIAFVNELSMICEEQCIDVRELIQLANRHPRVNLLQPGPGVGGHCIAVDPWFIVSSSPKLARLIRTAREQNEQKTTWVINKIKDAINEARNKHANPKVAIYGLSFKPNIDDIRESPAVQIAKEVLKHGVSTTLIVEPHISKLPPELDQAELVEYEEAKSSADIHVMLVNHSVFYHQEKPGGRRIDTQGLW